MPGLQSLNCVKREILNEHGKEKEYDTECPIEIFFCLKQFFKCKQKVSTAVLVFMLVSSILLQATEHVYVYF